jgi:hypothetical protein
MRRRARVNPRHLEAVEALENRFGRPLVGLLTELYVVRGMSEAAVAHQLGVAQASVHRWLVRYGIPRRHRRWEFDTEPLVLSGTGGPVNPGGDS